MSVVATGIVGDMNKEFNMTVGVLKLHNSGYNSLEIASEMKIGIGTVKKILKRHEYYMKVPYKGE